MRFTGEYAVRSAARTRGAFAGAASDRSGATAVEYGIIAAGIAVTIIAAVNMVGQEVLTVFGTIESAVDDTISPDNPGRGRGRR
jgi:pilus assembly protein Flp/PilA